MDDYIAAFSPNVRAILQKIRLTIQKAAPRAVEAISYGMPTFRLEGNLVHFAAFKHHIGLYPPAKGDKQIEKEAAIYAGPKGNLRFPLDEPIPYALIRKIVKMRVKQNQERARARKKNR